MFLCLLKKSRNSYFSSSMGWNNLKIPVTLRSLISGRFSTAFACIQEHESRRKLFLQKCFCIYCTIWSDFCFHNFPPFSGFPFCGILTRVDFYFIICPSNIILTATTNKRDSPEYYLHIYKCFSAAAKLELYGFSLLDPIKKWSMAYSILLVQYFSYYALKIR